MRGRADDPDLWAALYDRFRGPGATSRRRGGLTAPLPPATSERLYDAALAVLQSVRTLVDVAEEVLEDRRARLGEPDTSSAPWLRNSDRRDGPPSTGEGDVVRDIPFTGA